MSLILPLIKKRPSLKQEIVNYYNEQRLRQTYLFDFRGGSYNKDVIIYDPQRIYSAHIVNRIDIVSLFAKYQFQGPLSRLDAEKQWRLSLPRGMQFFELTDFQEYPGRYFIITAPFRLHFQRKTAIRKRDCCRVIGKLLPCMIFRWNLKTVRQAFCKFRGI